MGDKPDITHVEKVPSETLLLDKTFNSKCHNSVEAKIKDGQKKRQDSSKKKDKRSRKRKYSSSSNESDSDSDEDSSEDPDMDNSSSSESSKEKISQDEHISSRLSNKSSAKRNKWKFSKQFKK